MTGVTTTAPTRLAPVSDTSDLARLSLSDIGEFGGKNASLGEMIRHLADAGVSVPSGFATSASAFRRHLRSTGIDDFIAQTLAGLDVEDTLALAAAGSAIRHRIESTPLDPLLEGQIALEYDRVSGESPSASWAVRSSATAEDLPDASFAGQQETFLNISGLDNVIDAIRKVFASLFNDRAIAYRVHQGFDHSDVAISVGIQQMIRSDLAAAGVMFTIDTESGFEDVVFVTSAYGLGEAVVQGSVNPDEFYVYKPALQAKRHAILSRAVGSKQTRLVFSDDASAGMSIRSEEVPPAERVRLSLTDEDVTELARLALAIEKHYGRHMDIEWAKDGTDGRLYILQARPETGRAKTAAASLDRYQLVGEGPIILEGRAVGQRIGAGAVRILSSADQMHEFGPGEVLVADMTDPDWEPIMKRASAIVTNRGGRTCHAAIIARELGIPAVVGTQDATNVLHDGQEVTVTCADGDSGQVLDGALEIRVESTQLAELPALPVKLMANVGNPSQAFSLARLPQDGVGLARLEFIIARQIGIHPRALLEQGTQPEAVRAQIAKATAAYESPESFFVERLAEGVSTIAAAFSPNPVIVRLSDFKSNEYAGLLGGDVYEPDEENPMLGFRGASRYLSPDFAASFAAECRALRKVRDEIGLTNVRIMIPFARTVNEVRDVVSALAKNGLVRGENGLEVYMMCELPSNAILADDFLEHLDGFSIGSNDLTQLILGLDRDSGLVASTFDERNPAVLALIGQAIDACRRQGKYVGICGQGPSDYPDLAEWLVARGIQSISLNPDTILPTWQLLGANA